MKHYLRITAAGHRATVKHQQVKSNLSAQHNTAQDNSAEVEVSINGLASGAYASGGSLGGYFTDVAQLKADMVVSIDMPLSDSVGVIDSVIADLAQLKLEAIEVTDDFMGSANLDDDQYVTFCKNVKDASVSVEYVNIQLARGLLDAVAGKDLRAIRLDKALKDTVRAIAEHVAASFAKSYIERVNSAEVRKVHVQTSRVETIAAAELKRTDIQPGVKKELIGAADKAVMGSQKRSTDTMSLSEVIIIGYLAVRVYSDAARVKDSRTIATSLLKKDTLTSSEVGKILKQDYTGVGYFAEDYVGSSHTF